MKDFSILISTWNNCRQLELTLQAMTQVAIPDKLTWELVLVNNNCSDHTDETARKFTDRLPLVYVKEPTKGLSRARNKGLSVASGRLMIFTDDDVKPFPEWVSTYWSAYQKNPKNYFFGGPIVSEFENPDFDKELLAFAPPSVRGLDWGRDEKILGKNEYFIAPNWACPMEILLSCGGFNIAKGLGAQGGKVCVGEEVDLMGRLQERGWKPLYLPKAKIYHFVPRQKCTAKHIADRYEAGAFEEGAQYISKERLIAGIPRWMFREYLHSWKKWVLAKICRKKGYKQYMELRRIIGIMRGVRSLKNRNAL